MGSEREDIDLTTELRHMGKADELPPRDRARLALAKYILLALGLFLFASALLLCYAPAERLSEAREIFNFVKTVAPPLVTLVIGFYFNAQSD